MGDNIENTLNKLITQIEILTDTIQHRGGLLGSSNNNNGINSFSNNFDNYKSSDIDNHSERINDLDNEQLNQLNKNNKIANRLTQQAIARLDKANKEQEKQNKKDNQKFATYDENGNINGYYTGKQIRRSKEQHRKKVAYGIEQSFKLIEEGVELYFVILKSRLQKSKNVFNKAEKTFQAELNKGSAFISTFATGVNSITTQTASKAQGAIVGTVGAEVSERLKSAKDIKMAEQEFQFVENERELEKLNGILNKASGMAFALAGILSVTSATGVGAIASGVAAIIGGAIKLFQTIYNNIEKLDIEQQKFANEVFGKFAERVSSTYKQMEDVLKVYNDIATQVTEIAHENDDAYKKAGVTLGFQGDTYAAYMRSFSAELASKWGLSGKDVTQIQNGYVTSSGRNVLLGGNDIEQIEAMSRVFGVSNTEMASMMGEMNIFNTSISDGYDMMNDMYHIATKIGISTSKFSKDLTQNLKLAQKYNFKGGVDNMAKLTLWAEKTRFNLQNAASLADKMTDNNISNVLETTAKLQVLGGAASLFGDPMAMLWEAGNDVGALAKRQAAIFSDITGTFDRITGETTFSDYERRLIKARAEAMGMNYEDVLNQKRQSNKQGVINKALARYGLDEETLDAIGLRATYSQKRKTFVVNTTQGEKPIDELAQLAQNGNIQELLLPENTDDAIMQIALDVRSMKEQEQYALLGNNTALSVQAFDKIQEASKKGIEATNKLYTEGQVLDQVKKAIDYRINATNEQVDRLIDFMTDENNKKDVEEYRKNMLGQVKGIYNFTEEQRYWLRLSQDELMEILSVQAQVKAGGDRSLYDSLSQHISSRAGQEYVKYLIKNTGDGIGNTNGGYLYGADVTPINDGRGTLIKTHSNDQFIAAKSGGPIDKLFDIVAAIIDNDSKPNKGNNLKLEISGNINLEDNSGKINLVEIMKSDPVTARQFTQMILKAMETTNGKISRPYFV